MKKFFKKACVVLGIMGMGFTTTSCNIEDLLPLIEYVIQAAPGLLNGATQSVVYTGTLNVKSYSCDGEQYDPNTEKVATQQVVVEAIPNAAQKVVTIKISDFKVGDATISGFSFNTTYNDTENGKIGDKDAYYTGLTCTVNGHAASEEDYACICGTLNESTLTLDYIDFYTAGKKYEGDFSGKVQQKQ